MQKSDTPLHVKIEDSQLVIRIGIDRLNGHDNHPTIPPLTVLDRKRWAQDIAYELQRESEDGSTPLDLLIDAAIKRAIEMGTSAIDHTRPTTRDQNGDPCKANAGAVAAAPRTPM